jgi:hypothetical protein
LLYRNSLIQLLYNLCVNIRDKDSHILATYWVAACIGLHSFAMQCEDKERELDSDNSGSEDPFIAEGLSFSSSDSDVDLARDPHGFGVPARVAGTGTHGYGYGSHLGYP